MSTPLGYQVPGSASPFDIAGIAASIDRAASSLKPGERGSLTVQVNQDGFGAGLVVRGPFSSSILATVSKPLAGSWGYGLSARVSFATGNLPPSRPVFFMPGLRGLYRLFREYGNRRAISVHKALGVAWGFEARLLP